MKRIRYVEMVYADNFVSLEIRINKLCREEKVEEIQILQNNNDSYIAMVSVGF